LKNSQSLNEINPQQAHELLQKIYRHDPDKLKLLIREAQLQQTQAKGVPAQRRETLASLGSATLRRRQASFKQGRPVQQGFQEPISS
jgi:hypothetical protein